MKRVVSGICALVAATTIVQGCGGGKATAGAREDPRVMPARKFNPNVIEQPGEISYDVVGTTPEEVRASLLDSEARLNGQRILGSHSYWISYSYTTRATKFRCKPTVKFTVRSTTTLPKWKDREKADSSLRAQWDVFMIALTRHEDGHRDIAIKKVDLMQRRMTALEPLSCAELKLPMRQIFDGAMKEMRDEQAAWDANPANRSAPFIPGARRPPPRIPVDTLP